MISYKERVSLLEFLNKKPGVRLPDVSDAPETLEYLIRGAFDELQRSQVQLRERAAALEARNRELKKYDQMVAHDLKDPLTILIMTADLINDVNDLTREELRECTRQIKSIAYEMNNIITCLLLLSEVSRAEAPREAVHMGQVVANVQTRLSYLIRQQQAQLILPQVWPDAVGYAPWIEEVWANLLSNALKYGGRPPRVELGASTRPDGMLHFWTRDNGPGIPPETRTHLFQPHNQISSITPRGHGLGLSIVLHIVEKLGGQVGVESEVGEGSLFFFTLPAAAPYAD
jgi:two-component system, sensor histidine kinase and response regulator